MRVNLISDEQRQQNREMDVRSLARYVFRQLKENLVLDHNSREFFSSVRELRTCFKKKKTPQELIDIFPK